MLPKECSFYYGPTSKYNKKRQVTFLRIIEEMEPFRDNNRILDVGSGEGNFLRLCSDKNWDVFGVEPNPKLANLCKNLNGVEVVKVRFEQTDFPENFFDAITFINVLEHMKDPSLTLKKAHRIIRPGGAVLIRFPNGALHVRGRRMLCHAYHIVKSVKRYDIFTISFFAFDAKSILVYLSKADFVGCRVINDNSWALEQIGEKDIWGKLCKNLAAKTIEWLNKFSGGDWFMAPSLLAIGIKRRELES